MLNNSLRKPRLRPVFKDISLTFFTKIIVLGFLFFIYRLIARNFGPEGMGEYSLIRRVFALFQPLLILGLSVGLPRYIAMSKDKTQRISYAKVGFLVVTICTLFFLLIANLFKVHFAKIFFGNIGYANLVLPLSFLSLGLIFYNLIYSYLRGKLLVKAFNLLQFMTLSLIPLGVLVFFENITIEKLISLMGIIIFAVTFIFSLFVIREIFGFIKEQQYWRTLRELLRYSLPRIPGDFALAGILCLGPIFAAHFSLIREVGYLSISQILLTIAGGIMAPAGLILLPKISRLIVQDRSKEIKESIDFLTAFILQCFIFICVQSIIFTDVIIKFWLTSGFTDAVPIMRIVFLSVVFYAFYMSMRSILDATEVKPLNAINIFISLGVFLLVNGVLLFLFKFFTSIISLSIAFSSGLVCLGILTYFSVRKIYPADPRKDLNYLWIAVLVNILLGIIAVLMKPFVASKLCFLILFEVSLGIIYLSILWLLKVKWIRNFIPSITTQ